GRNSRTSASCSSRSSGGTKPRMPTPHGRPSSRARVSSRSGRASPARMSDSARNGSPPASATAAANGARSETRVIGPCAIGERRPGTERIEEARLAEVAGDGLLEAADQAAGAGEAGGERPGERGVGADRDAEAGRALARVVDAAVERRERVLVGEGGFREERELRVEDHALGARRGAGGGGVEADAALDPDGGVGQVGAEALEEDECGLAVVVPARDEPMGALRQRRPRLIYGGDLDQRAPGSAGKDRRAGW